jgi:GrpB-like predicted nucleotidyltransferase (UPF0157 family)
MSLSLGLAPGTVRVVRYDSAWPKLYAAEVARLQPFLLAQSVTLAFEHTGSTAVPGLVAKPVLDILAGRGSEQDRGLAIAALENGGYAFRGEQGILGRDFFRRGEPRQYHLHLAAIGSPFWLDHRAFRDYLRANAEVAAAYGKLKTDLATRYPRDREAYINGKSDFVAGVLAKAGRTNTCDREA